MPRYPIDRSTNFIVEDESWNVIEYDHTSVPGTIYLSLTENKINSIYDDVNNDIADTDKLAKYELLLPNEVQTYSFGDIISPIFTLTKNGIPYEAEVELLPTDKKITRIINGKLTAVGEGETQIIVRLKEFPTIQKLLTINVNGEEQMFSGYIDGAATVRLDRDSTYEFKGTSDIIGEVTFSISNDLAAIVKQENNSCIVHANNKNRLGEVILTAVYDGKEYTKTLTIIPLW